MAAVVLDAVQTFSYLSDAGSPFLLSSSFHSFLVCCSSSISSSISTLSTSMDSISSSLHPTVKDAAAPPIPRTTSYPRLTPKTIPLKHIHRRRRVGNGGGGGGGGDDDDGGFGFDEGFGRFGDFGDVADSGGFGGLGGFGGDGGSWNGGGDGWRWNSWGDSWNDEWRRSNRQKDNVAVFIYQLACWLSFTGCVHHVLRKTTFAERRRGGGGSGGGGGGETDEEGLRDGDLVLCRRQMLVATGGNENLKEVISC